jgi:uncharacterized protein YdaU (DUF1376 family)
MAKRPFFALYPADYQVDTPDLSFEQHGVYLMLLQWAWQRPQTSLPNDPAWFLHRMPQGSKLPTFNRLVRPILDRFFVLNNGEWLNPRLSREAQKANDMSTKATQSANKRWAKTNENKDLADTKALRTHMPTPNGRDGPIISQCADNVHHIVGLSGGVQTNENNNLADATRARPHNSQRKKEKKEKNPSGSKERRSASASPPRHGQLDLFAATDLKPAIPAVPTEPAVPIPTAVKPPTPRQAEPRRRLPAGWTPADATMATAVKLIGRERVHHELRQFTLHAEATGRAMARWDPTFLMWVEKSRAGWGGRVETAEPRRGPAPRHMAC